MNITLKRVLDSDFEYGRKIHKLAYKEMVIRQFGEWEDSVALKFFTESWNRLPHCLVFADDQKVGYCCIEDTEEKLQIREFAIDPAHQGRGIGRGVLEKVIEQARNEEKLILINVMKTNPEAKKLYLSLGFAVYDENDFQYLLKRDFSTHPAPITSASTPY